MESVSEFMSNDHHRLDRLFDEFKKKTVGDRAGSIKLFAEFKAGLEKHIGWEEGMLFRLVDRASENGPTLLTDELRTQHKRIKSLLDEISSKLAEGKEVTKPLENELELVLNAHDKLEENDAYPWIDKFVDSESLKGFFDEVEKGNRNLHL